MDENWNPKAPQELGKIARVSGEEKHPYTIHWSKLTRIWVPLILGNLHIILHIDDPNTEMEWATRLPNL